MEDITVPSAVTDASAAAAAPPATASTASSAPAAGAPAPAAPAAAGGEGAAGASAAPGSAAVDSKWEENLEDDEEDDEEDEESRSRQTIPEPRPAAGAAADGEEGEGDDDAALQEVLEDQDAEEEQLFKRRRKAQNEHMKLLLDSFTPEQRERHEVYRRSKFKLGDVKKSVGVSPGSNAPSKNVLIVMAGIAKVYVGEIVEQARDVMDERKLTGPITPDCIREAVRRLKNNGTIATPQFTQRRFLKR